MKILSEIYINGQNIKYTYYENNHLFHNIIREDRYRIWKERIFNIMGDTKRYINCDIKDERIDRLNNLLNIKLRGVNVNKNLLKQKLDALDIYIDRDMLHLAKDTLKDIRELLAL